MKTINDITTDFNLNETGTGGNCKALSTDLNTNQDQILITDGNSCLPVDGDNEYEIAVFLNGEYGEPAHTFETTNVDHLYELVQSVFSLWGN